MSAKIYYISMEFILDGDKKKVIISNGKREKEIELTDDLTLIDLLDMLEEEGF